MQRKICASVFLFTQLSERTFNTQEEPSLLSRVVELPTAALQSHVPLRTPGMNSHLPAITNLAGWVVGWPTPLSGQTLPPPGHCWAEHAACAALRPTYVHPLAITLGDMPRDF